MPVSIAQGVPTLFIRRASFERAGLTRAAFDRQFTLTDDEFRVEGGLVCVGPLHDEAALAGAIDSLERLGLVYYEDFFELSGRWPDWLALYAMASRGS
jgi:hypothetical protein